MQKSTLALAVSHSSNKLTSLVNQKSQPAKIATMVTLAAALAACGGSGSSSSSNSGPVDPGSANVQGGAGKGVIKNGRISVYRVADLEGRDLNDLSDRPAALLKTVTDSSGRYVADIRGYVGPVVVEVTAFAPDDGITFMICDLTGGCDTAGFGEEINITEKESADIVDGSGFSLRAYRSSLSVGDQQANLSVLTALVSALIESNGSVDAASIQEANTQVAGLFGLEGALEEIEVVDITDINAMATATQAQQLVSLVGAAIAQVASSDQDDAPISGAVNRILEQYVSNGGQLVQNELGNTNVVTLEEILEEVTQILDTQLAAINPVAVSATSAQINSKLAVAQNAPINSLTTTGGGTAEVPASGTVGEIASAQSLLADITALNSVVDLLNPEMPAGSLDSVRASVSELTGQDTEALLNVLAVAVDTINDQVNAGSGTSFNGLTVSENAGDYTVTGTINGVVINVVFTPASSGADTIYTVGVGGTVASSALSMELTGGTITATPGLDDPTEINSLNVDVNVNLQQVGGAGADFSGAITLALSSFGSFIQLPTTYSLDYSYEQYATLNNAVSAGTGEISTYVYPDGRVYIYDENPVTEVTKSTPTINVVPVTGTGTLAVDNTSAVLTLNPLAYQTFTLSDDYYTENAQQKLTGSINGTTVSGEWSSLGIQTCLLSTGIACGNLDDNGDGVFSVDPLGGSPDAVFNGLTVSGQGSILSNTRRTSSDGQVESYITINMTITGEEGGGQQEVTPPQGTPYLNIFGSFQMAMTGDFSVQGSTAVTAAFTSSSIAKQEASDYRWLALPDFAYVIQINNVNLLSDAGSTVTMAGTREHLDSTGGSLLLQRSDSSVILQTRVDPVVDTVIIRGDTEIHLVGKKQTGTIKGAVKASDVIIGEITGTSSSPLISFY